MPKPRTMTEMAATMRTFDRRERSGRATGVSGVAGTLLRVDFADSKNGWIVGRGGVILRSGDKGLTWVRQDSGTTLNLFGLFMDKKYGWAVGQNGLILKYKK